MKNIFLAISSAGPNRDFSKGTREQLFGTNMRSSSINSSMTVLF